MAVQKMPPPTDVCSLKSFLGSVQFYAKFLPANLSTIAEPLYQLTRKDIPWKWEKEQQQIFRPLKATSLVGLQFANNIISMAIF